MENARQLWTADGHKMGVMGTARLAVQLGEYRAVHEFLVAEELLMPVIIGVDFLSRHSVILDYSNQTVRIRIGAETIHTRADTTKHNSSTCYTACTVAESEGDTIEECAVPQFGKGPVFDIPSCMPELSGVIERYKHLFSTVPGSTNMAFHTIETADNAPIRVPPRRIPAHFRDEIQNQLQDMLARNIIRVSSSPWLAPAVYVPKKNGDIRICIDYRELKKRTIKDSYPLPLPDEVQDRLAGSQIFSKLDLHSGYWQKPIREGDCLKTAFSPGPGMGLYEFCRMPFGVTGGPSSFQRLMDKVLHGLPFVTSYIDDILVHSKDIQHHKEHLEQVFARLSGAGLTLRGAKCQIGMKEVPYLGHVFSAAGMVPDANKIAAVRDWPTPKDVSEVRQFIGLASYYRRYVKGFADIATPLHQLTEKTSQFLWTESCQAAFEMLKKSLTQAPVLCYPSFDKTFILQTDASAVGIGAVLEQEGQVVAYASRSLTLPERQYSVIERECLAVVFAVKQFRHYLLGQPFVLYTDHLPLQWLSAQKMEGRLCRWALALQEFDFEIKYRRGSTNTNADALSRIPPNLCAFTQVCPELAVEDVRRAQQSDKTLQQIWQYLSVQKKQTSNQDWRKHPLKRYGQILKQLHITDDGVLCRSFVPGPLGDTITVPVLP